MKFSSVLSVFAFMGAATAGVARRDLAERQLPQQYAITIKTGFKDLNNKQLSMKNDMVGVSPNSTPLRVTTATTGKKSAKTVSIKPYPNKPEENALGLVGINGFLELRDLINPSKYKISGKETYSWKEFTIGAPDKKGFREITYKGVQPGWIASPSGDKTWSIKNYDGDMVVVQNYIPIKLYLEPVPLKINS